MNKLKILNYKDLDPSFFLDYGFAIVEDTPLDKVSLEDKLDFPMHPVSLEPYQIQELTQAALAKLPEGLEDYVDVLFDIIYDAISEALEVACGE